MIFLPSDILKNLTTPIFLVGLIYRWGKGLKPKMIKTVCFLHNMRKNKKKNFFFTFFDFFDFFDFLERKYDFLEVMEHFINIL